MKARNRSLVQQRLRAEARAAAALPPVDETDDTEQTDPGDGVEKQGIEATPDGSEQTLTQDGEVASDDTETTSPAAESDEDTSAAKHRAEAQGSKIEDVPETAAKPKQTVKGTVAGKTSTTKE
jgi:hypothetical protein